MEDLYNDLLKKIKTMYMIGHSSYDIMIEINEFFDHYFFDYYFVKKIIEGLENGLPLS